MAARTKVNEVYAAVQGEGPLNGLPSIFVRFHLCPVECEWCDTAYTWDGTESGESMSVQSLMQLVNQVANNPNGLVNINKPDEEESPRCVNHIVITGGEPMVQKSLHEFIASLRDAQYTVEVETACIFEPKQSWLDVSDEGVTWNLSPKLPSAKAKMQPNPEIIKAWVESSAQTEIKLVINDADDLLAAYQLIDGAGVPLSDVMMMPCATSIHEMGAKLRWLYPIAMQTGFRVIGRTHITAYNGARAT